MQPQAGCYLDRGNVKAPYRVGSFDATAQQLVPRTICKGNEHCGGKKKKKAW